MLKFLQKCSQYMAISRTTSSSLPSLSYGLFAVGKDFRPFGSSTKLLSEDDDERTGRIASKTPFEVSLVQGKKYFWCRCGQSKKQPWCDGSHKGTGFIPLKFMVEVEDPEAYLCGCKQTGTPPHCDGTHATPLVQDADIQS